MNGVAEPFVCIDEKGLAFDGVRAAAMPWLLPGYKGIRGWMIEFLLTMSSKSLLDCSAMRVHSILLLVLLTIAFEIPASARAEQAALIDFNNHDERSVGTVAWRMESIRAPDGHNDPAIRADIDIPDPNLKLKLVLRRNFDPTIPADYVIELAFAVPASLLDGSVSSVLPIMTAPAEMSGKLEPLGGPMYKLQSSGGQFVQLLSRIPSEMCGSLSNLRDGAWMAIYLNGAKRKPGVFRPAVATKAFGSSGVHLANS